jgi:cytochrome c-type biogenesis protein CcmF
LSPDPANAVATSPIAVVGTISLLVAFVLAAWCVTAGIVGSVRKNQRLVVSSVYGLYAFASVMGLSAALIIYAFVTHDFSIKYVAMTSDTSMSTWYKITAFWGGLDGSLQFWVLVLALFAAVAVKVNFRRHRDMIGYVVATIMAVQLFFLALLVFTKHPFATFLTEPPADGRGLNPLLQNYWMVIHPPSLYIGFVAATIPFAFGVAALASGRLDDMWLASVRSWMLVCFFFLTLGLILGGRWAYEELGWGGYWAWDPVENAGLLPWFTATAFLHSVIIQEQRGMFKRWNLWLVFATFFLTIMGTFMTRAGIVQSVHAFGEDSELALQFVIFMMVLSVVAGGLIQYRANQLRSTSTFESFISREFAFLLNNWILLGCAFFVFFATMLPTISEAFDNERVSVGIPFFNKWMTPLGLTLLFLAGAAPLLAWGRTTRERLKNQFAFPLALATAIVVVLAVFVPETRQARWLALPLKGLALPLHVNLFCFFLVGFLLGSVGQEYWRGVAVRRKQTGSDPLTSLIGLVLAKRRKYGGYIVHVGIAMMFVGFVGKSYDQNVDRTIARPAASTTAPPAKDEPGVFSFRGYDFRYQAIRETHDDTKTAVTATVSVYRDGEHLHTLDAAQWDFHRGEQPTTEVGIYPRVLEDVYVVLTGYDLSSGLANFRVYVNPLINWVWAGTVIALFGTLICLIPLGLVERLSSAGPRAGAAAVLVLGAVLAGGSPTAHADPTMEPAVQIAQAGVGEHVDRATQRSGHNSTEGGAHLARPTSSTATELMKELVCLCGGCQRESLYDCKCGYAAEERKKVLLLLLQMDLTTETGRKAAYDQVVAAFVKEYGGKHVLSTPQNPASWALPLVALGSGLILLLVVGRRWVSKGRQRLQTQGAAPAENTQYAERLDDELREID